MNSRSAWFWAFTAAILFLGLVSYERFFHRPPVGPVPLLPGFVGTDVRSIKVVPSKAPEVQVVRTNDGAWVLTRPIVYPAQGRRVEALLSALETMVPATTLSGTELRKHPEGQDPYGVESPLASIVLQTEAGRTQLLIGTLTAPGDQVFVQVVGREGVSVIDAEFTKLIPASPALWRDTGLFDLEDGDYDRITVASESGTVELQRAKAPGSWEIVRPMSARADGALVASLIRELGDLAVESFVSDDPRADRVAWGLQPAELRLSFMKGSNLVQALDFGSPVEGGEETVYAIGRSPSSVVEVPSSLVGNWSVTPNDFRERQLIRAPAPVNVIEVSHGDTFSLIRSSNGVWRVEPDGFAADPATLQRFIKALEGLRVSRFVKDVVAGPDLPAYGLAEPRFRVVFNPPSGADRTTARVVGLEFGSGDDESVFVRRTDENAVYAVKADSLEVLPAAAGHFRQLRVWNFAADDVSAVSVQKGDKSWRLTRNGQNQWALAPGSQGIVNPFAIEEIAHRLGALTAIAWTDWDPEDTLAYGLSAESVSLGVELKDGSRRTLQFGFPSPAAHVYAGVTLSGRSWVFEFPSDAFDLIQAFLIQPSDLR